MLKKCMERYRELANRNRKRTEQLYKVSSPCLDDHQIKKEEPESVGEWSEVCTQIALKCLHLARIGRPDILWSVNELARSITKWTRACDRRLARRLSNIHHTPVTTVNIATWENTAQHCRWGLFQDSDFAGDLQDSKSTSGGVLCIFGSRTFVPISWMYKKQTSVWHGSTESEIISLDAGLRMDGLLALHLWDIAIEVLRSTQGNANFNGPQLEGNRGETKDHTQTQTKDDQTRWFVEKRSGSCERRFFSWWISVVHLWG